MTYQQWKETQATEKNYDEVGNGTMNYALKVVRIVLRNGQKTGNQYFMGLYNETYHTPITNPDIQDLVSIATLSILENSQEPLNIIMSRAFKAVNSEIWKNRRPYDGKTLYIEDEQNNLCNVTADISDIASGRTHAVNQTLRKMIESDLTTRQRQVLILAAKGYSYRQICERLGLKSSATVAKHIQYIRQKASTLETFDNSRCSPYVSCGIHTKSEPLEYASALIEAVRDGRTHTN